jgi:asparagine synthase (glutamine-hydrolysing)
MCGVAGLWSNDGRAESLDAIATAMRDRLRVRGPDDAGLWSDRTAGIALGQRRLSIIDLSPHGHQPMVSGDGRWVLDYNGEIYNYRDVAEELAGQGVAFRGASDTEVLLEAIARFGVEAAIERMAGMFAFAAWDRAERRLFLARDRLGIKPMYYGWSGRSLLFASELKAFDAVPGFAPELDRTAVTLLLRHAYIPAPRSVWKDVFKLPPGHLLECRAPGERAEPREWWSARRSALRSKAHAFRGTPEEAVAELETVLGKVVREHMIADVPLGAFLSGGIDSSTVVALMQKQSARPVKTFTIGFHEDAFDEAGHARRIAAHLGTDHTELYLHSKDAEAVIPDLPEFWDEPYGDSSQIPTYLVSRLARSSVTVSLSGDGGDELFGGYTRYLDTLTTWERFCSRPPLVRAGLAGALRALPGPLVDAAGRAIWRARGATRPFPASEAIRIRADIVGQPHIDALYRRTVTYWQDPAAVVLGGSDPLGVVGDPRLGADLPDPLERMMLVDSVTYLPDDILTKVDRASMAVSLEARVPVLDHRVFELAWRLPIDVRIRDGRPKWPLREILARHVPRALFERPKQGFGVPIGEWLRGPLREWSESLLAEDRLRREGIFEPRRVRRAWADYLNGWPLEHNLWVVLMFQAWWERRSGRAE